LWPVHSDRGGLCGLLIDSHAHLDSPRYVDDRAEMLRRAVTGGVGAVLSIGIGEGPSEMHQALEICREFNGQPGMPRLYASAGIYPHSTPEADEAALAKLDGLLAEPEVIACGEIGLDYYHEGAEHVMQRAGLVRQLEIAAARKRPILIHCRPKDGMVDAWNHLFLTLDTYWRHTGLGGVMHCFGGEWEQARRSLDMGFLISFAGNLTYAKAQPLRDVAAKVPMDGLLVETDAPWLAPGPSRGKRNEPAMVVETAKVLAAVKGVEADEIAQATTKNFKRLFSLGPDVGN
jgi:TatD DNase family protein